MSSSLPTSPQLHFFSQILQATNENRDNPQVVYSLLQENLNLLDDTFAQVLRDWAIKTLPNPEAKQTQNIAVDIVIFSELIQKFPLGNQASNLEIAIAGYEVALTVLNRQENPQDWAIVQYNLGTAYFYRIQGERPENLERAIIAYTNALQVCKNEAFPPDWGMTPNNLGNAYFYRIRGDRADNIEQAIAVYKDTLQVYTREAFPEQWAMTHKNLGRAYFNRIRGERAENLEHAITVYQAALLVYTHEAFPVHWANIQHNLGSTYQNRIREDRAENLEMAIDALQKALSVLTHEAFPVHWAEAQYDLGLAYKNRIKGDKAENLELALAAYQAALSVQTRDAFPQDWALTQNNLGNVYCNRIQGDKARNVELAIAAYEAALQVYNYETDPEQWAMTQYNLGVAYCYRILGNTAENLELAIAAYEAALQVYTYEAYPRQWVITRENLGSAWCHQGVFLQYKGRDKEAIIRFSKALEYWTNSPEIWNLTATSFRNLGLLEDALTYYSRAIQIQSDNPEFLFNRADLFIQLEREREAIADLEQVLISKPDYHKAWCSLGIIFERQGNYQEAVVCYNKAIKYQPNSAYVWFRKGYLLQQNLNQNEEAIACFQEALELKSDYIEALNHVAISLQTLERYEEALVYYNRALEIQPDFVDIRFNRALLLANLEREEQGLIDFDEIIRLNPNDFEAWYQRGNVIFKLNRHEEAIACYRKALEIKPDFEEAKNRQEVLIACLDENRRNAYLNLIKTLSTCSSSEELQILDANQNLVDLLLVAIMEYLTSEAEEKGQFYSASILTYLSRYLSEKLGLTPSNLASSQIPNPKSQIEFFLQVGNAITENHKYEFLEDGVVEKFNQQALFDLLEKDLNLLDDSFPQILRYWGNEFLQNQDKELQRFFATYTVLPFVSLIEKFRLNRVNNLEIAITACEVALTLLNCQEDADLWAKVQLHLGIFYCQTIQEDRDKNLKEEELVKRGERSITACTNALQVFTRDAFPEHWASVQNILGNAYSRFYRQIRKGQPEYLERAIAAYKNALQVTTREQFPEEYANTTYNLGVIYRNSSQLQLAYKYFHAAIETVEFLRGQYIFAREKHNQESDLEKLFLKEWRLNEERWNRNPNWNSLLYRSMIQVCLDMDNYTAAIEYVERSKARNLVELLMLRDISSQGSISEAKRNAIETSISVTDYTRLNQRYQQYNELYSFELIKFDQIKNLIDDRTAIIEWYIVGELLYAFIITRHTSKPLVWKSSEDWVSDGELMLGVWEARKQAKTLQQQQECDENARICLQQLAASLHIDNILDILFNISETFEELILIPHLILQCLPFHALPVNPETPLLKSAHDQTPNPCLLDCFKRGVRYINSCQMLQQLQKQQRPQFQNLFGITMPTPDLYPNGYEYDLGASEAIRKQFTNAYFLRKDKAKKSEILRFDEKTKILTQHEKLVTANCLFLFCHGYLSLQSTIDSFAGLQLADENLTVADIVTHLDLKNCRLVTLSACETGLTMPDNITMLSDDYIGLPYSFLLAGSTNVVSSLWSVSALATALLMIKFYEELKQQSNIALALNNAQRWLRDTTVQGFQDWLGRSTLNRVWQREWRNYFNQIQVEQKATAKPFEQPFYWAAFYAIGKGE
ncbi:tetratricopeptide repeat protein [Scytonema hofmannii FACHB-248]|uniref:Tetratricopeptide repeat protein n=1 Tax=Scytonema hofmannii FACHB-248 TaxID=1842502 RepID=A0ABR8GLL4_9CYAN|nr:MULTISPECIES: CHAT domain-containing protein [Nostocales]MBD2604079.1 tetratricopeptide repeat protein [Scytonema hofmannii FACHB-248]